MSSLPTIAVISSLDADHQVRTKRFPHTGEKLIASDSFIRCGGKGANTCVAAARVSRKNPARVVNGLLDSESNTASDANIDRGLSSQIAASSVSHGHVPVQVRMIGAVGYDDRCGEIDMQGREIINQLHENGVNTEGVRAAHGKQTGSVTGIVATKTGKNTLFTTHLQPVNFLTLESLAGGYRPDLVVCNLVIPRETTEQILETASSNGISTLLNLSPARYLLRSVYTRISHLILNETEAAKMTDMPVEELNEIEGYARAADKFLDMGVKNVVITLGATGACYSNVFGQKGYVEAQKGIKVVDATGAGDTFTGAYAVQFVRQKHMRLWDMREAVEYGCKAASRTIQAVGAPELIP